MNKVSVWPPPLGETIGLSGQGELGMDMDLSLEPFPLLRGLDPRVGEFTVVGREPIRQVPSAIRVVEAVHGSARSWMIGALDAVVLAAVAMTLGLSYRAMGEFAAGGVFTLYAAGVYRNRDVLSSQGVAWYGGRLLAPFGVIAFAGLLFAAGLDLQPRFVAAAVVAGFLGLICVRAVGWCVLSFLRRRGIGLHPTVLVGHATRAAIVESKLRKFRHAGLAPLATLPLELSTVEQLPSALDDTGADHVIFVPETEAGSVIAACAKECAARGVRCAFVPVMDDVFLHPVLTSQVAGVPLLPLPLVQARAPIGKRIFDAAAAAVCLVLLAPLMGLIALAIKINDGGSVFYRQPRVGLGGKTFFIIKFRSMIHNADQLQVDLRDRNMTDGLLFKMADDPRVTKVGQVLRRLCLDELPQLLNVVKGDMSLVGPRPLHAQPHDFESAANDRHQFPPGITGYWQLNGGNALTYDEMVKLDLAYIQNWSLWLDLLLLLRTIPATVLRPGPW